MGRYTADMLISDVLAAGPEAARVFESFDLGCAGCLASGMESVSAVASSHDVSVDELLEALNAVQPSDAEEV